MEKVSDTPSSPKEPNPIPDNNNKRKRIFDIAFLTRDEDDSDARNKNERRDNQSRVINPGIGEENPQEDKKEDDEKGEAFLLCGLTVGLPMAGRTVAPFLSVKGTTVQLLIIVKKCYVFFS